MSKRRTVVVLAACLTAATATATATVPDGGRSFTDLAPGFTQELRGTQPAAIGGIGFALDGDAVTIDCAWFGSDLHRFDAQHLLPPVNGTSTLHPRRDVASAGGCGLADAGGVLFSNTELGITRLDPDTGAWLGRPSSAVAGNASAIVVDPVTQDLVFVARDGTVRRTDRAQTATSIVSSALTGEVVGSLSFPPDGSVLLASARTGSGGTAAFSLVALDRTGAVVRRTPAGAAPEQLAFHETGFAVGSGPGGTLTRFDFPAGDFGAAPTQTVFASGGFTGRRSQVGRDGCLHLSQDGTRYDDGTTSAEASIVRVCGGFLAPLGLEGPAGSAACADGADADADGFTDQQDAGCQEPEGPLGDPTCADGIDNDADGSADAADADCDGIEGPAGETCRDRLDNDGDHRVDAEDPDCGAGSPDPTRTCFGVPSTIRADGTVTGTRFDDVIVGGKGADVVDGKGGDDLICTGDGADVVRGGAGDDRVNGGHGDDDLRGQAGADVVFGGPGDDSAQGGDGDDLVRGQDGDDVAAGGPGADRVHGDAGADLLAGGDGGPDRCDGGADAVDRLVAAHGCETVLGLP